MKFKINMYFANSLPSVFDHLRLDHCVSKRSQRVDVKNTALRFSAPQRFAVGCNWALCSNEKQPLGARLVIFHI